MWRQSRHASFRCRYRWNYVSDHKSASDYQFIISRRSISNPTAFVHHSSGIAKKLKEHNPDIIVVGVDPEGSLLALPEALNDKNRLEAYHVEGIGYDFIPDVLDRSLVDQWFKSNDTESLVMMRRLIRDEGLLCGGSSGAAVSCALRAAASLKAGQKCVIILPDSVRNYMTKALSDDWMLDNGFVDNDLIKAKMYTHWWAQKRVYDLPLSTPLTITSDVTCKDAISLLKEEGFDMVPVLSEEGAVIGVVTEGNMTNNLLSGRAMPDESVEQAGVIYKTFHKFSMNDTLANVASALDHDPYVLIVAEQRCFSGPSGGNKRKKVDTVPNGKGEEDSGVTSVDTTGSNTNKGRVASRCVVSGIVTRIDLLDFVSKEES
jgi:cystathionine beta-synthase